VQPLSVGTIEDCHRMLDADGYAVVRGVVDPDVLQTFAGAVDTAYSKMAAEGGLLNGGGSFSGHLNCYPGEAARAAYEQVRDSGVLDVIRSVRPDLADRPRITLNYNLPGSVPQHYHMDGMYVHDFLICNVAVVDTDLVNGAIDVLPGSHRTYLPYWKYAAGRTWKHSTRLPLGQGDVLIRRSTLWHRGMPNRSAHARPMLAVTFGEVQERDLNPLGSHGGDLSFFENWYRPTALGRLRERVSIKAPWTYSMYRFVRSLDGRKGYDR
jgi:hypothetical protein